MNTLLSRIIWFVPIFISAIVGHVAIINQLRAPGVDQVSKVLFVSLALLIVMVVSAAAYFIIFRYERTDKFLADAAKKREIRKAPFIFKQIKGTLEYLDPKGHELALRVTEHVADIKRFDTVSSGFEFKGEIHNISVSNNSIEPIRPGKLLVHKEIKPDALVNGEYVSDFYFEIKDGFKADTECWKISVKSYCISYEFQVIIPASRRLLESQLLHTTVANEKEKEKILKLTGVETMDEYDKGRKLVIRRQNSTVISIQLAGVSSRDVFMVKWTLSPELLQA